MKFGSVSLDHALRFDCRAFGSDEGSFGTKRYCDLAAGCSGRYAMPAFPKIVTARIEAGDIGENEAAIALAALQSQAEKRRS